MQPIVRVFVSSTWLDLQPERFAVEKALQRMHQTKLNGMEYFGSRDETTREVSLREVDGSDIYVGIIGGRYGSGITEEEYQRARQKQLPCFLYFKTEELIPKRGGRDREKKKQSQLVAWKEELRKAHALGTGPFTSLDDLAARVTADLSNWLLDRYGAQLYLDGVRSLPFDYAGRIENFLSEYLGTAKAPVPFGGREKDLKALDAWLEDPAAPSYFMMAAPAGRGKSALLVRWTRQVLARANIALVFVPISIRFRTNLSGVIFAALAARLARLHGDKIPDTPSTSVETWRGLVTEYLRRPLPSGEKLLVVLDGLDEAADWEAGPDLFPLPPPDHVRVVVSTRYRAGDESARDWLRRLGWGRPDLATSYDLDKLTSEGVGLVLKSMGFPLAQLGVQVDIVAELYRLSEGDPLLVRLYVDDLWTHKEIVGSLKPEDLRKLQPGLKGYFDRWWADQRTLWGKESPLKEQNVQTVLNALAYSLGPLNQDDVLYLTRNVGLTTWGLEEALKPLERFVIGDGKINGYVLSHPRLGEYFENRLSTSEQQAWQQRFLDWGKDTVQALEQGTLAPAKAPTYIVQYYGAHLEQAHASAETQLTLVCQGWSKAREALEGSFAGFLNDVERAWKAAERENEEAIAQGDVAPRIGDEIRCALVRASINSLATNIPVELIVQLVKYQKWTFQQGLVYARQNPNVFIRADTLVRLATETDTPTDLLDQAVVEALASARALDYSSNRAKLLADLAPHMPQQERPLALDEALVAAQALEWEWERSGPLRALAPHLPEAVFAAIQPFGDSWPRAGVLAALARYRPEAVLATAQEIHDHSSLATVLTALAPHVSEQKRELMLDQAWSAAQALDHSGTRAEALAALAPHRPKDVLDAAQELDDDWDRATVLVALAPYRPEAAFAAAPELDDSKARAKVLAALVQHVPRQARSVVLDQALTAARALDSDYDHAQVLATLAPYQPEAVLAAAREIHSHYPRATVLATLAPHVSEQKRELVLDQAWAATQVLNDSEARARVLTALTPHVSQQERELVLDQAWAAAQALDHSEARAKVLTALAPHRPDLVLAAARTLDQSMAQAEVLAALAPYRPEVVLAAAQELAAHHSRAKVLAALAPYQAKTVWAAAREIHDHYWRATVLAALVPHVSQRERELVLDQALVAARQSKFPYDLAKVLASLAPHQPEAVLAATQELVDNWSRTHVLAALAPYQPEAVLATAQSLDINFERLEMLVVLAPQLRTLSLHHIYSIWRSTLRHISAHTREKLMDDLSLSVSISVIEKLGQGRALESTLHAVQDVTTWWP